MKIALIVPGGVDRSGEYRVIPALLALLREWTRTNEVHVFSLARASTDTWKSEGATIHECGAGGLRFHAVSAIEQEHQRGPFDVIQSLWAGWPGFVAVRAAGRLGRPACVHVAGGELAALPEIGYGGALHWYTRLRERWVLRQAAAVSAASAPIIEQIARLGVSAARIPLGVDLGAWPPLAPRARDPAAPARLVHVASLNRVKDQTTLLRAVRLLVDGGHALRLDMIGEDTLGGEIQRLAQQLGLGAQVQFHGFLAQRELRPFFEAAHLNLVSSRHEAGPLVCLEAAVVGVPTVGTAVGHVLEWAPQAALSAPVGDAQALADAIARLLDDDELRVRIAHEAQRRACDEDSRHGAQAFEAVFARLTAAS